MSGVQVKDVFHLSVKQGCADRRRGAKIGHAVGL